MANEQGGCCEEICMAMAAEGINDCIDCPYNEHPDQICENCIHSGELYKNPNSDYLSCDYGKFTKKNKSCDYFEDAFGNKKEDKINEGL